jgi:hypothetical protein
MLPGLLPPVLVHKQPGSSPVGYSPEAGPNPATPGWATGAAQSEECSLHDGASLSLRVSVGRLAVPAKSPRYVIGFQRWQWESVRVVEVEPRAKRHLQKSSAGVG